MFGRPGFTAGLLAATVLAVAAFANAADLDLPDPLGTGGQGTEPPADDAGVDPIEIPPTDATGFDGLFADLGFGGAFALGFAVALGLGLLAAAAMTLGTKFVTTENVLDNEARRTIFEYVKANPGVHLRAAATALNLSTTNVLWHLRKLEQSNLVASRKFEGYKVFYPSEGGVESRRRAIASSVLRNPHARAILEYIVGNPSAHQREIARTLGVNHGTVRWHLRKMNEAGLILQMKKENHSMYYVSELGNQALAGWPDPVPPVAPPQEGPPAEASQPASP